MLFRTQFRSSMSLGLHDPGLAPPPLPSAAGEYFEVRVRYLHALVNPGHAPEVVPAQLLTRTLLAPRREFLALGPTSFRGVLANMGAAAGLSGGVVPAGFIDSLGAEMRRVSTSIAENPALAAARVLTLRLYVVAETMTAQATVEAEVRRRANAYVGALEEVMIMASDHDDDQCTICLEELFSDDHVDDHDKVVRTPCSHVYHKACIARWLRTSRLCPLCRYAMPIS